MLRDGADHWILGGDQMQAGRVELLAVASIPALEALELGDVVTCPDGITGFVAAIDGDRVTVLTVEGEPVFDRSQLVKIEIID